MAFPYDQNFNALSDGSLDGQDSWSGGAGVKSCDVSTDAACRYEGAKGIIFGATNTSSWGRTITNTTSGSAWWAMKGTSFTAAGDGVTVELERGAGNPGVLIKFAQVTGVNKLQYYTGSAYADIVSPVDTSTWYVIEIDYDTEVGAKGEYTLKCNGTTIVTGQAMYIDSTGGFNHLTMAKDVTHTGNVDTWSSTNIIVSGPGNLKSLDTNVKSNIKSYNTNLIANIKSIDTNA